jgi:hypothetical protein
VETLRRRLFAAATIACAIGLSACGQHEPEHAAPWPDAASAHATCHYVLRRELPEGAAIEWADPSPEATRVAGDVWTVRVVYQVLHHGGPRINHCKLRALPTREWQIMNVQ